MLVLSRKKNESIVINDDITIVVVEIRGDKVRLGVEAPKEVPVHRREVYEMIKRNELARDKDAGQRSNGIVVVNWFAFRVLLTSCPLLFPPEFCIQVLLRRHAAILLECP